MKFITPLIFASIILGCSSPVIPQIKQRTLSKEFKSYWYDGTAEISSFTLEQSRYGETHTGNSVLIYVTEDFLANDQVKANNRSHTTIPILKLNHTKNFNTGIYPYSIMESIFHSVKEQKHAEKISSTVQEWCGQMFTQLNNRNKFEIRSFSYFEGEADQKFSIQKNYVENEIWTQIRINPKELIIGDLNIIPSLAYAQMFHKTVKAYPAETTLTENETTSTYTIKYPALKRELSISFLSSFPYRIIEWEERFLQGTTPYITRAHSPQHIKIDYWNKNSVSDGQLRDSLHLK